MGQGGAVVGVGASGSSSGGGGGGLFCEAGGCSAFEDIVIDDDEVVVVVSPGCVEGRVTFEDDTEVIVVTTVLGWQRLLTSTLVVIALEEKLDLGEQSSLDGVSISLSGLNILTFDCSFLFCFLSLSFSKLKASAALVFSWTSTSNRLCSLSIDAWSKASSRAIKAKALSCSSRIWKIVGK